MQHRYYITGFMGSGKTTIGQALAKKINYKVIDIDHWIEENEQRAIKLIFQEMGEAYFRELETKALQEINGKNLIITTGGGIVTIERNREIMKQQGKIIYLKCELEEVFKRLEGDTSRPNLQGDKKNVEKLFQSREEYYEEADYIVDTTHKTVLQIVNEINVLLKS